MSVNGSEEQCGVRRDRHGRCHFRVWAPFRSRVALRIVLPREKVLQMERNEDGIWSVVVDAIGDDTCYFYRLDDSVDRPDPASQWQPDGVHGPSRVVRHDSFCWGDRDWKGFVLSHAVIYEIHVGAFSKEGTFDAVIGQLGYLKELGITAIELMPVAQFPGSRNWGYDGTYPFAPQNSYGGPDGLKRLVDACHRNGLAVILDVVYNHLGPEGNYLADYGPYFTGRYRTPWGNAVNFDGPDSGQVRRFFIDNALYWIGLFHIDALRVDAIHSIYDFSAKHVLDELTEAVHRSAEEFGRRAYVIAESDLNDVRVINPKRIGGYGLDAQWNDDFHHALHCLVTGESDGYYQDFGHIDHLARAFREGFVYSGQYSRYRRRIHGNSSRSRPPEQFVVFSQNHDQIGNRPRGDRLSRLLSLEKLKLTAGVVLFSPFIPLLFMGEEYGERANFQYFISHSDPSLIEAVRKGRREEFASFQWEGAAPDPQDEASFFSSKIDLSLRHEEWRRYLADYYRTVISLRKNDPVLSGAVKSRLRLKCRHRENLLLIWRRSGDDEVLLVCGFNDTPVRVRGVPPGIWRKMFDSSDTAWGGPGTVSESLFDNRTGKNSLSVNPFSILLYRMSSNSMLTCGD